MCGKYLNGKTPQNGHFADQQCWKDLQTSFLFPKDHFGIVNKGHVWGFLNSSKRLDISYLILAEVISTAQFRQPKSNNDHEIG